MPRGLDALLGNDPRATASYPQVSYSRKYAGWSIKTCLAGRVRRYFRRPPKDHPEAELVALETQRPEDWLQLSEALRQVLIEYDQRRRYQRRRTLLPRGAHATSGAFLVSVRVKAALCYLFVSKELKKSPARRDPAVKALEARAPKVKRLIGPALRYWLKTPQVRLYEKSMRPVLLTAVALSETLSREGDFRQRWTATRLAPLRMRAGEDFDARKFSKSFIQPGLQHRFGGRSLKARVRQRPSMLSRTASGGLRNAHLRFLLPEES